LPPDLLPDDEILKNLVMSVQMEKIRKSMGNDSRRSPLSGYFLSNISYISNPQKKERKYIQPPVHIKKDYCLCIKGTLWERIDSFLYSLSQHLWSDVSSIVQMIIGMGPGLTPSGDDFLAGFLSVGIVLGDTEPGIRKFTERIARILVTESIGRTTSVSISMIEDASNGEIAEPALYFIRSVLLINNTDQIKYFARKVFSMGGYSGEDLLNGVATGIWFFKRMASSVHSTNKPKASA
jgi:hypothetical protein